MFTPSSTSCPKVLGLGLDGVWTQVCWMCSVDFEVSNWEGEIVYKLPTMFTCAVFASFRSYSNRNDVKVEE